MASSRHKVNSSRKEERELGSRPRDKDFGRSDDAKSRNSDRSTDDVQAFEAVDVVVDVHRELERKEQLSREKDERIIEILSADVIEDAGKKSRNGKRNVSEAQPRNIPTGKRSTLDDSLDRIEEFRDSEPPCNSELFVEDSMQVPRRRKQWRTSEGVEEISRKPPRKRWSKNASVFRLPETTRRSSSAASTPHGSNPSIPVPAPRSGLKHNAFFSFDNPAFMSDNDSEDVLRIETNYNDNETTRIEMRSMKNIMEEGISENQRDIAVEVIKSFEPTDQNRGENKMFEDNIETIEISNESDTEERSLRGQISPMPPRRSKGANREEMEYMFEQHSRKNTRSYTNVDSHENRHHRSCSEQESGPTSLSRRSSTSVRECSPSENVSKAKIKRREDVDEVRSKSKSKKKKKKKSADDKKGNKELKYISITIHRADVLETDYITKHPMVKVHIVEAESGNYLKSVVNDANPHLQPIITGKFDFKENKSMVPVWEEEVIFEHDFNGIERTDEKRVLILFEVLDLLSFAEASCNYDRFGNEGCWYKIAWAFLKPVGTNGMLHLNKMVRLQLYRPRRTLRKGEKHKCEAYHWWKSNVREKYASSLYVTVTPVEPPKLEPVLYQQLSFNDHSEGILNGNDLQRISISRTSETISLPKWKRLTAQTCKIPNEKFFETEVSENGCFFVAFSNSGQFLACVNSEEYDYPIIVYEIETQKVNVQFKGHKTFVYSVHWCNDDRSLLSVSSDQTARVWDVRNKTIRHIQLLPHPSYVYCGKFDPRDASIVATGCYDRVVRIWCKERRSTSYELVQELEGHEGFVNSMCFQKEGNLLTADSVGLIIVWAAKRNRRAPSRREWQVSRKIKVREMEGVTINTIVLHPMESRLLAHSRNNGLRMLDLATGVVLQKYKGLNNQRIQSIACISPCGGLILCGGEDSSLNVWSFETGKYLARYTIDRNYRAVTCVDYHPHDHVLAFSTFGSPAPVRLLKFDKFSTGEEVGLKIFTEDSAVTVNILNETEGRREEGLRPCNVSGKDDLPGKKNFLSRSLNSSRHGEPFPFKPEDERIRESSRLKLDRRLHEMEMGVKSNSTNRLYHIIEKIDRILSNTSRSSDDIESGRNIGLEKRNRPSNDNAPSGKSSRSQQGEDLNLSDDSKIETLRMGKLEIENEMNNKQVSRSGKTQKSEKMTQSHQNSESQLSCKKRGLKNLREQLSDGSTSSVKSKNCRDPRRSKSNFRQSFAHSDQSRTGDNGDYELEVRQGSTKTAGVAYLWKLGEKRARSAKGWGPEILEETALNAFSDSAAHTRQTFRRFVESQNDSTPSRRAKSMPAQSSDSMINSIEERRIRKVRGIENLVLQNNLLSSTTSQLDSQSDECTKSPHVYAIGNTTRKHDSTSDSGGTYVLEKANFESNQDLTLPKMAINENSSSNEKTKNSDESRNSLKSNTTFIMEHEKVPIPKPRRKRPS